MRALNPRDFRLRMFKMVQSELVAINKGVISDPAASFGDVKQSGLSREGLMETMSSCKPNTLA